MRIRKVLVIVFSILIFTFSGCENQDNEKVVKTEAETLETEKIKTEKIETVNSETPKEDEEKVVRTEAEILEMVNNETPKEKLIKNSYEIDLEGIFDYEDELSYKKLSLEELDLKYPIECIRKSQLGYYVILKDVKDEWYYILFLKEEGKYLASSRYHYKNQIYKKDFEKLKEGVSTLEDVREIDPYGKEIFSLVTGRIPFSVHITLDGYIINIDYHAVSEEEENYIVNMITIKPLPNDYIINNLIKIDELK